MSMVYLITFYANVYYENIRMNQIEAILQDKNIPNKRFDMRSNTTVSDELIKEMENAELVCISPAWISSSIDLGRRIKEAHPKTLVIYEYPTENDAYREIINDYDFIDFIALGNAGLSIHEFLASYDGTNSDQLIRDSKYLISKKYQIGKEVRPRHIKDFPWKKHNEQFMHNYLFTHLDTTIGCAANCSFCGGVRDKWSGREPEEIVEEIQRLEAQYNIRAFNFTDKSIEDPIQRGGKDRFEKLCDLLIATGRKYAFSAYIRAESFKDNPKDRALLEKARRAGFVEFFVGVEAGNEEDLRLYNKRATVKDNKNILSLLPQYDINPYYGFIMLNPYSTPETLKANYQFLSEEKCYIPGNYIFYLFIDRSLPIVKKLIADGLISRTGYHMLKYRLVDPFAQAVYDHINDTYVKTDLFEDIIKIQDQIRVIDMMLNLVDNVEEMRLEYNLIKAEMAEMLSQYYHTLYIKQDIDQMYKSFDEYYNTLKSNYIAKLAKLVLKFYKGYCRQYNYK